MSKYVYVVSNPAFDGWLKVGKTSDLSNRLWNYNTGSPLDYEFLSVQECPDKTRRSHLSVVKPHIEREVHNKLLAMSIVNVREWFKTDLETMENAIAEVITEWTKDD